MRVNYVMGCHCERTYRWNSLRNSLVIFVSFVQNLLKLFFLRMKETWQMVSNRLRVYRADIRLINPIHVLFSEGSGKACKAFFRFLYLLS